MALRYAIQGENFKANYGDKVLPAYPASGMVTFRAGAQMGTVAEELLQNASAFVDASFAAGKSVRLPSALAAASRKLVYHVVPNRLLALDLYNYVSGLAKSNSHSPELCFLRGQDQVLPTSGVVFCGASTLVSRMLSRGLREVLAGVVLYLDEAHESDAYTYTLRTLGRAGGAANVILASATLGPNGFRATQGSSPVQKVAYPEDALPERWNLRERGKPWCIAEKKGNILVFVDSRGQAEGLRILFEEAGLLVYRLESGMPDQVFSAAMRSLRDKNGQQVVLLADYSFRNGFTFDVCDVIDTGRMSYYSLDGNNSLTRKSRRIFSGEMEQSANRAGRLMGRPATYYYPEGDYLEAVCELEGVEKDAAALLYRCFGFRPNDILADSVMANLRPKGVSVFAALSSAYPLALQPMEAWGIKPTKPVEKAPEVVEDTRDLDMEREEQMVLDNLAALAMAPASAVIAPGRYYSAPSVGTGTDPRVFPDGYNSVLRLVQSNNSLIFGKVQKTLAIRLVIAKVNFLTCEMFGLSRAVADLRAEGENCDAMAKREWAIALTERYSELKIESCQATKILEDLASRFCEVEEVPREMMYDLEQKVADRIAASARGLPGKYGRSAVVAGLAADINAYGPKVIRPGFAIQSSSIPAGLLRYESSSDRSTASARSTASRRSTATSGCLIRDQDGFHVEMPTSDDEDESLTSSNGTTTSWARKRPKKKSGKLSNALAHYLLT